jgi:thiol-disulfide isomerase/thioredoxin
MNPGRLAGHFGSLLAALVVISACGRRATEAEREDSPPTAVASAAPSSRGAALEQPSQRAEVSLEVISGATLLERVSRSGKKATLVNAWASWCGPCRREIPMLQALEGNLAAQGVAMVLVSVDEHEDAPKAISFLRDQKVTLKSYLAERPLEAFKRDLNPRWPGMLPATFLYDSEGKLRYFWGGEAFENEIVPVIEGFLSGKPIDGEKTFPLAPGKVEH